MSVSFIPRVTAAAWLAVFCIATSPTSADSIAVVLDQAQIVRLPDRVATLVIGNPSVADGTLQAGGLLVITGKGYGTTNMIALDARGEVIAEHTINVAAPKDGMLTVWRGVARETWTCAPRCERSVMLGDGPDFFSSVVGQTAQRNDHAAGQAPATAAK